MSEVVAEGVQLETMVIETVVISELLCAETEVVINKWMACNAYTEGNLICTQVISYSPTPLQHRSTFSMGRRCFQIYGSG
jgi:hypothetical protein